MSHNLVWTFTEEDWRAANTILRDAAEKSDGEKAFLRNIIQELQCRVDQLRRINRRMKIELRSLQKTDPRQKCCSSGHPLTKDNFRIVPTWHKSRKGERIQYIHKRFLTC